MTACPVAQDLDRLARDQQDAHDAEAICERAIDDHAPELAGLLADPSALSLALQSIPGKETMEDVDRLVSLALLFVASSGCYPRGFFALARKLRLLAIIALTPAAIALAETRILSDECEAREAYLDSRRNR